MKKIKFLYIVGVLFSMISCQKFLDINQNPNSPTTNSITPELILGGALARSSSMMVQYNSFGAWVGGQAANAGGFGGWGVQLTYDYATTNFTGLWETAFDIISDYQQIIAKTEGKDIDAYYNAIAKIMKVFHYQYLVDTYNDVPYSDALLGVENVSPKYENAKTVYKSIYLLLDDAINTIKNAQEPRPTSYSLGEPDIMFAGDMTKWIQFANTLKLRIYIRASNTDALSGIDFSISPEGYLTEDAQINPGYQKAPGQQNPHWESYHSTASDGGSNRSWITTYFIMSFYNGNIIEDTARANVIYRGNIAPARNQLGVIEGNPTAPNGSPVWYSGDGSNFSFGQNIDSAAGILKGPGQSEMIFSAAESYLLQSEAALKNIISGDYQDLFKKGIAESFYYLYKNQSGAYVKNILHSRFFHEGRINRDSVSILIDRYFVAGRNVNNYLVNIDLASNDEQRLEAIITQKYIALNFINAFEGWAEYRRTGYPKIQSGNDRNFTFVSLTSAATTPDRTLGRVLYPASEYQLNSANVPSGITVFGSYVFWDRRN